MTDRPSEGEPLPSATELLEHLLEPAMLIRGDYVVVAANRAAQEFSGLEPLTLRRCFEVNHGGAAPCPPAECPLEQLRRTKEPLVLRHVHRGVGGAPKYVDVFASPLLGADGEIRFILETCHDVTAGVELLESLGRERAEREAALRQTLALEQAQDAIRARDDFLSIAGHELQTPVTAILLQLELTLRVLREASASDRDLLAAKLAGVVKTTQRLSALVRSLLDVARIAHGRLDLNPTRVELVTLTAETIDELREQATKVRCPIELVAPTPVIGSWDAERIRQVLSNLIANALKFGAGHPVIVRVEGRPDSARLSVVDQGCGIALEEQERIFGRFERGRHRDHLGGLGIGLYVARELTEAHGGALRVTSSPGQGATFTVDLPLTSIEGTPTAQG